MGVMSPCRIAHSVEERTETPGILESILDLEVCSSIGDLAFVEKASGSR